MMFAGGGDGAVICGGIGAMVSPAANVSMRGVKTSGCAANPATTVEPGRRRSVSIRARYAAGLLIVSAADGRSDAAAR